VLYAYQVEEADQAYQTDEPAQAPQTATQTKQQQQECSQRDNKQHRSKRHLITPFLQEALSETTKKIPVSNRYPNLFLTDSLNMLAEVLVVSTSLQEK
jgi:hypothetical protein